MPRPTTQWTWQSISCLFITQWIFRALQIFLTVVVFRKQLANFARTYTWLVITVWRLVTKKKSGFSRHSPWQGHFWERQFKNTHIHIKSSAPQFFPFSSFSFWMRAETVVVFFERTRNRRTSTSATSRLFFSRFHASRWPCALLAIYKRRESAMYPINNRRRTGNNCGGRCVIDFCKLRAKRGSPVIGDTGILKTAVAPVPARRLLFCAEKQN